MTFLWPNLLWLLMTVPLLIAAYLLLLRRKRTPPSRRLSHRPSNLSVMRKCGACGQVLISDESSICGPCARGEDRAAFMAPIEDL